jgi:hypothetical protein
MVFIWMLPFPRRISAAFSTSPESPSAPKRTASPPIAPSPAAGSPATSPTKPPYQPNLSELIAILHHEAQQVIEYLAQPQLRQVTSQTPSASFVKIESIQIEIPVRISAQAAKATQEDLARLPILQKPFILPDGTSLTMYAQVLGVQIGETTKEEGKLRVEFSVAAK